MTKLPPPPAEGRPRYPLIVAGGTRTIHHRDYRPRVLRGDDRVALIALCGPCHDRVHYAEGQRKRNWDESERVLRKKVIAQDV